MGGWINISGQGISYMVEVISVQKWENLAEKNEQNIKKWKGKKEERTLFGQKWKGKSVIILFYYPIYGSPRLLLPFFFFFNLRGKVH